ncbi:helix-turn-helix domain-containing protein [Enterococcus rotai]|uniref:helix-turn-helix domain-containing protein n=1 Tax=Enterococcus rotai TaxID=118060 RepID=UPI0032B550BD
MDYGKAIKELRIERGLTQKNLSKNICSRSVLSLIEQGNSRLYTDHLEAFLKRMNVSWEEFWYKINREKPDFDQILSNRIYIASQSDPSELIELLNEVYEDYKKAPAITLLGHLIWIASLLDDTLEQDHSTKILAFLQKKVPDFIAQLNKNDSWGKFEFKAFINSMNVFSTEFILDCYTHKLKKIGTKMALSDSENFVNSLLINGCFLSIKRNELHHTRFFLSELSVYLRRADLCYEKNLFMFLKCVYNYKAGHTSSLEEAEMVIQHFRFLNFTLKSSGLEHFLKKVIDSEPPTQITGIQIF